MIRALHLYLPMVNNAAAADEAAVGALLRSTRIGSLTHVILYVRSHLEVPDALSDPVVRHAINVVRERKLKLVLGRNVWVSWPGGVTEYPAQAAGDHLEAAMWAAAIGHVKAEAVAENAQSALQLEIYGNGPMNELEHRSVVGTERERTQGAIAEAVAKVGQVDFVRPGVWARDPDNCYAAMGGVGRVVAEHHLYSVGPPWTIPPPERPVRGPWLWGTNVEVVGWDAAMSWTPPAEPTGCVGQFLWFRSSTFPAVLLGEGG